MSRLNLHTVVVSTLFLFLSASEALKGTEPVHKPEAIWNHGSRVSHFRSPSAETFAFTLQNGTKFTPKNATDLEPLVPELSLLHPPPFLTWLEDKSKTERIQITVLIQSVNIEENELKPSVQTLIRFNNAEVKLADSQVLADEIADGTFIQKYLSSTRPQGSSVRVSKKIFWKSLASLRRNRFKALRNSAIQSSGNSTALAVYEAKPESDFDLIDLINTLPDLISGIQEGDFRAIISALSAIFGDIGGIFDDLELEALGGIFGGYGIIFNVFSIGLDIANLIVGNLQGLDLAIAIVDLISNITSLVITIAALVSATFSAVAGPIGLVVGLIFGLIGAILEAIQKDKIAHLKVTYLNSQIHLTPAERQQEFQRFRDGKDASQYLLDLGQQKAGNNLLVDHIVKSLNEPSMSLVKTYVSPAYCCLSQWGGTCLAFGVCPNNEADLRSRSTYNVARWAPDQSAAVICCPWKAVNQISCFPQMDESGSGGQVSGAFKCKNALGVDGVYNTAATYTLVSLGGGADLVYGSTSNANIFMVDSGTNTFYGGSDNDIFMINSTSSSGSLHGSGGNNTLVIDLPSTVSDRVNINLEFKYLNTDSGSLQYVINDMQVITGRTGKAETINPTCGTLFVDGGGGTASALDEIQVKSSCKHGLGIALRGNTRVSVGSGPTGIISYNVTEPRVTGTVTDINFGSTTGAEHRLLLDFEFNKIRLLAYEKIGKKLQIYPNSAPDPISTSILFLENSQAQPIILTKDEVVLRVNPEGIFSLVYRHNGTRDFQGVSWAQSIVYVSATSSWRFTGSTALNDSVVLEDLGTGSSLNGNGGKNSFVLDNKFQEGKRVNVDLLVGTITTSGGPTISLSNFANILGRNKSEDYITPSCETVFVDGQGIEGDTILRDRVEIKENGCAYNLVAAVKRNTKVVNTVTTGSTFIYPLSVEPNIEFDLTFSSPNVTHVVQLQADIVELQNATVILTPSPAFKFESKTGATVQIPLKPLEDDESDTEPMYSSPLFLTKDAQPVFVRPSSSGGVQVIYNITSPEDVLVGTDFGTNFFLLNSTVGTVKGGSQVNVYVLGNSDFSGRLEGNKGIDRVLLDKEFRQGQLVNINLLPKGSKGKLGIQAGDITFVGIEEVAGRENAPERVTVNCETTMVDGQGGHGDLGNDTIIIPPLACTFNFQLVLQSLTTIQNQGKVGSIFYRVETDGYWDFVTGVEPTVNHTILTGWARENLTQVLYDSAAHTLRLVHKETKAEQIYKLAPLDSEDQFVTRPRILSEEIFEFKVNKEGKVSALYVLKEDDSSVEGFSYLPNIFVSEGLACNITGGDFDDTIIINNATYSGTIKGGAGNNTISVISDTKSQINMVSRNVTGEFPEKQIAYSDIQYIQGNNVTSETVWADCSVTNIDLGGATDKVYVPNLGCSYSMKISVYDNLVIENSSPNGSFFYVFREDLPQYQVLCNNCSSARHTFVLPFNFSTIENINVSNETKLVTISTSEGLAHNYSLSGGYYFGYPSFLTSDLIQIEVSHLTKQALVQTNESVPLVIPKWKEIATKLNISVTILSTAEVSGENVTTHIHIGKPGLDVLTSSPRHRSILIGNGGANFYVVGKGETQIGSLGEVTIQGEANSTEIVDLTQAIRTIRENVRLNASLVNKTLYVPEILYETTDLVIKILDNPSDLVGPGFRVVIKDWAAWYMNVTFILNEAEMELKFLNGKWSLEPVPIVINETNIVFDQSHFEDNQVIVLNRNFTFGNGTTNSVVRNGKDLMLTNVFNATSNDMFVTVFQDYLNPVSARSLTGDEALVLPMNIQIKFQDDFVLHLDEVEVEKLRPIEEVVEEEEMLADLIVWGFKCTAVGKFPDPRYCDRYHECILVNGEWIQYEFECPLGTVFCRDLKLCSFPGTCLDCNDDG